MNPKTKAVLAHPEDADGDLPDYWVEFFRKYPGLDLTDEDQWERIDDPREHLRRELGV